MGISSPTALPVHAALATRAPLGGCARSRWCMYMLTVRRTGLLSWPLADADRRAVATRLDLVGPVRLADVVLDLDGDALAAWLADLNAT